MTSHLTPGDRTEQEGRPRVHRLHVGLLHEGRQTALDGTEDRRYQGEIQDDRTLEGKQLTINN